MSLIVEPVWRQVWSDEGYVDTGELIGYRAVDERGQVLAYGETPSEALENGLEILWLPPREKQF